MKNLGMGLVALGLLALIYGGVDYNRSRTIIRMGSMKIAASEHRSVPIPAIAGVVILIGGVALLVGGSRRGARS